MLPKVSQILHLLVNSIDEEDAKMEYKARIADVTEDSIMLEIPIDERTGRLKQLYMGDELSTYFFSKDGVKNYFNTSVTGFLNDVIKLVAVKKPELQAITTIQRRSFFRVPAQLEIAVKYTEQLQFIAITDDVGGGGISFICDVYIPLTVNFIISCWLLVLYKNGSIEHVPFKGDVVRVKQLETGQQLAMVSFVEITDRDRQKLIRFCFERQMDFRKK